MFSKKQLIRIKFRNKVFSRDRHKCRRCGVGAIESQMTCGGILDAHHIVDRNEIENGGYILENGITLCPKCHLKAEAFHKSGGTTWEAGYHPNDLINLIQ